MSGVVASLKALDKMAKERRKNKISGADEYREIWHNCRLFVTTENGKKLYPVQIKRIAIKNGFELFLHLPKGMSDLKFHSNIHRLRWAFGGDVEIIPLQNVLKVRVIIGTIENQYDFMDHIDSIKNAAKRVPMPVPIGFNREGLIILDLTKAPHMLCGGLTSYGKSNWLHTVITTLIMARVLVYIIDLKRLEFAVYQKHTRIALKQKDALAVLKELEAEMDRRLDVLMDAGVVKIQNYRGGDMPYIACIIDEIAELQDDKAFVIINRLVRLARAVGISLIVATQRPSTNVIDGDTRAMFGARMCFRVADEINSRMILGEKNNLAAYLPAEIKGRAIYSFDRVREVQAMYLPAPEQVAEILSSITPKPPQKTKLETETKTRPAPE